MADSVYMPTFVTERIILFREQHQTTHHYEKILVYSFNPRAIAQHGSG